MKTNPEENNSSSKPSSAAQSDDRLSQITTQLFQQLKRFLPIDSIKKIEEKLDEIELGNQRLPLKPFLPYIGNNLFPITSEEDLHEKLSIGLQRGVAFIGSGGITVGNKEHIELFTTSFQASEGVIKSSFPNRKIFRF